MLAKGCLNIFLKLGNLHKALSLYSGSGTHTNRNLDIIAFWVRISVFLKTFSVIQLTWEILLNRRVLLKNNSRLCCCCCLVGKLCPTLCNPMACRCQASLSFTISWNLLKFMSSESVTLSKHLILSCPLLLLPSIFPNIKVFCNESALCMTGPKNWSFRISPSNEYSGWISFRIDWFDLLAAQGTLKSLLQHQSLTVY